MLVSTHLMDEAERCHRLAVLDRGVLVADGTPAELTGRLEGRTFVVASAQPRRAQQPLAQADDVLGVAQVGNELRVIVREGLADGDEALARLKQLLAERDPQARIEPVQPNLEDVFVAVTRQQHPGQERAA